MVVAPVASSVTLPPKLPMFEPTCVVALLASDCELFEVPNVTPIPVGAKPNPLFATDELASYTEVSAPAFPASAPPAVMSTSPVPTMLEPEIVVSPTDPIFTASPESTEPSASVDDEFKLYEPLLDDRKLL